MTGADTAEAILAAHGIAEVEVTEGEENLYSPMTKELHLTTETHTGRSTLHISTAAHEAAHAVQHSEKQPGFVIRTAFAPVVWLASYVLPAALCAGVISGSVALIRVGLYGYPIFLAFQLMTLYVEHDASRRAIVYLKQLGFKGAEIAEMTCVLRAARNTYFMALLAPIGIRIRPKKTVA